MAGGKLQLTAHGAVHIGIASRIDQDVLPAREIVHMELVSVAVAASHTAAVQAQIVGRCMPSAAEEIISGICENPGGLLWRNGRKGFISLKAAQAKAPQIILEKDSL